MKKYAIRTSDGHDEDWSYYSSKKSVMEAFESMKELDLDIHVYEYNKELGYEVIDSYSNEEDDVYYLVD